MKSVRASAPGTIHESSEKELEEEVQPKETTHVFKILPVDPKHSFDFEDVADK